MAFQYLGERNSGPALSLSPFNNFSENRTRGTPHHHPSLRGRAASRGSVARGSYRSSRASSRTSSVISDRILVSIDAESADTPSENISSTSSQFSLWSAPQKKRQRLDRSQMPNQKAYRGPIGEDEDEEDDQKEDEEEEDDEEDGEEILDRCEMIELPLACPFHKREPTKFCVQQNQADRKMDRHYRTCAGPGFPTMQRLKEHLKRKHFPVQCARCYMTFPGRSRASSMRQLECHGRQDIRCEMQPESLREGISDAQWANLNTRCKKKKNHKLTRVDRYWMIWDTLFPGVKRPDIPWHEAKGGVAGATIPGQDAFRRLFTTMLDFKVTSGDIQFLRGEEETMKNRTIILVENAFKLFAGIQEPAIRSESTVASNETVKPKTFKSTAQIVAPQGRTSKETKDRHRSHSDTQPESGTPFADSTTSWSGVPLSNIIQNNSNPHHEASQLHVEVRHLTMNESSGDLSGAAPNPEVTIERHFPTQLGHSAEQVNRLNTQLSAEQMVHSNSSFWNGNMNKKSTSQSQANVPAQAIQDNAALWGGDINNEMLDQPLANVGDENWDMDGGFEDASVNFNVNENTYRWPGSWH